MSKSMSMTELGKVLKFARESKQGVHYIDPVIDNRAGECFSITFRGLNRVSFNSASSPRTEMKSLHDRCMTYLSTGEVT